MPFLDHVLQPPSYGWNDNKGELIKPTVLQILKEFFTRLNVVGDRKNWLPFFSWLKVFCLLTFFFIFLFNFLHIWTLLAAFVYSMIIMGTHGTIWHHRYCTHGAYTFRNAFWRFFTQNLTINVIPEEIYVISHHVHHAKSDQPGDPYNAYAGFLYCFLADVISWILNWSFWYITFYMLGGHALACSMFGAAGFWAIGVRTFNYEGHGKGEEKQREGVDYNHKDNSVNQLWPGIVAGEWHNNHHLFPKSARSGFKPHQIDFAWYYIKFMSLVGAVSHYKDFKKQFMSQYHQPYQLSKTEQNQLASVALLAQSEKHC